MAINKVPNNYYNDTNIRRDKINTLIDHVNELDTHAVVPTPAAGDEGKVPKVNAQGEYELATDEALPSVTTDDNTKMLQVGSTGEWGLTPALTENSLVVTNNNGRIVGYRTIALLVDNGDPVEFHFLGKQLTFSEVITRLQTTKTQLIDIFKNGVDYCGFVTDFGNNAITAFVSDGSKQYYASIATSSITLTEAKELPAVGSFDNGSMLSVRNGSWQKSSAIGERSIPVMQTNNKISSTRNLYGLRMMLSSDNTSVLKFYINEERFESSSLRYKLQTGMPLTIAMANDFYLTGSISFYDPGTSSSNHYFYGFVSGITLINSEYKFSIYRVSWHGTNGLTMTNVFTET